MKILHLSKQELRLLKKSFILTAIILTIFLAALFGMLSVQTDLMRNLCEYLDQVSPNFDLTVYDVTEKGERRPVTFDDIGGYSDKFTYAVAEDFSRGDITSEKGVVFDNLVMVQVQENVFGTYSLIGHALCPNDGLAEYLSQYNDRLDGRWVQNPYEICLSRYVATELGVQIGEKVSICDVQFVVVGVYDWEDDDLSHGVFDILSAHVFTLDGDRPLSRVVMTGFNSSAELFSAYRKLQRKGVNLSNEYDYFYKNINVMQAIFSAIDVIFAIVIVATLYSLVSMLLRQRKTQICRLKILGASDRLVAGVYCGMIIALLFVVVACATALGVGFNYYFIDLCEDLFEFHFTAHFNFVAPLVALTVFCGVTYLLWKLINYRTKSALATEIRYE